MFPSVRLFCFGGLVSQLSTNHGCMLGADASYISYDLYGIHAPQTHDMHGTKTAQSCTKTPQRTPFNGPLLRPYHDWRITPRQ